MAQQHPVRLMPVVLPVLWVVMLVPLLKLIHALVSTGLVLSGLVKPLVVRLLPLRLVPKKVVLWVPFVVPVISLVGMPWVLPDLLVEHCLLLLVVLRVSKITPKPEMLLTPPLSAQLPVLEHGVVPV